MGGPERSPEFLALEALLSVSHYETLVDRSVCCDKSLFTDVLFASLPSHCCSKNDFLISNCTHKNTLFVDFDPVISGAPTQRDPTHQIKL